MPETAHIAYGDSRKRADRSILIADTRLCSYSVAVVVDNVEHYTYRHRWDCAKPLVRPRLDQSTRTVIDMTLLESKGQSLTAKSTVKLMA